MVSRKAHLKKKYKFYKKKKSHVSNIVVLIIIALIIAIVLTFNYVNKKVRPILLDYALIETKKLATIVVSKAVNYELAKDLTVENLFVINKSEDGRIQTIDLDPSVVNTLLLKATTAVQTNLKYLEEGNIDKLELGENALVNYDPENLREGIFYKIPAGVVFNNALLANIGPKIPVRFSLVGEIIANIETHVTNYGINNALVDVQMNLKLNQRVILPIDTKDITVSVNVPLTLKIVQGVVPEYYFSGTGQNSQLFTLPID